MGGVDLADQHIQVYEPDFRSVKLWKKLLVNMILRVIGNAFKSSLELKTQKITSILFTSVVISTIIEGTS